MLVAHLSDIHFRVDRENPVLGRVGLIARAILSRHTNGQEVLVALTGDIAFSGTSGEYQIARQFLSSLRTEIATLRPGLDITVATVPGNHDCMHEKGSTVRTLILDHIERIPPPADQLEVCLQVQQHYADFNSSTASIDTHPCERLAWHQRASQSGRAWFLCLNTAWMSRNPELQGTLRVPLATVGEVTQARPPGMQLCIALMHHPFGWLEANNARDLRRALERHCDMILTGHEHASEHYTRVARSGEQSEYIEGGVLQEHASSGESSFNVIEVSDSMADFRIFHFSFSEKEKIYLPEEPDPPFREIRTAARRTREDFALQAEFESALESVDIPVTHSARETLRLSDIFCQPELIEVAYERVAKPPRHQPIELALAKRFVSIVGEEQSGRTALSRRMFVGLRAEGMVPLLAGAADLREMKVAAPGIETVLTLHAKQYKGELEKFRQLPTEKRALLFDDFDEVSFRRGEREKFISAAQEYFGVVVLFGGEAMRLESLSPSGEWRPLWDFTQVDIVRLGAAARYRMIERWHSLDHELPEEAVRKKTRRVARMVDQLLGGDLHDVYPVHMLLLLQHLESTTPHETIAGSHGALYEVLITQQILQVTTTTGRDVNLVYTYLTELAWLLFQNRSDSVGVDEFEAWHESHVVKYEIRLPQKAALTSLCRARLLRDGRGVICFEAPYLHYYFVARYIRDHLSEDAIRRQVRGLFERLHHREAANVVIFLCYLSRDPFILQSALEIAAGIMGQHDPVDLAADTAFCRSLAACPVMLKISQSPDENRATHLAHRDARDATDPPALSRDELAKLDGDATLDDAARVNGAFKTIQIMGQLARNFHGALTGEQKRQLIEACFDVSFRTLGMIYRRVGAEADGVVQFFSEYLAHRYPERRPDEIRTAVRRLLFTLMEMCLFGVARHVATSVGDEKLRDTLRPILRKDDLLVRRFLDAVLRMEISEQYPEERISALRSDLERIPVAAAGLRRAVWQHFFLSEADYRLRQRVCVEFDITITPEVIDSTRRRVE